MNLTLRDGRGLTYDQVGDLDGFPVVYLHGGNGSRLEARWFEADAIRAGFKVVAPDRPGFGLSDPDPNRSLKRYASDISQLADHLGLEQLCIVGLSGGGPHALAVAHELPDRVAACAVVSSLAPPRADVSAKGMFPVVRLLRWSARYLSPLNRLLLRQMQSFYADPDRMRSQMVRRLPAADRDLLSRRPEIVDIFSEDAKEAHRQGLAADAQEWKLYVHDWGFDLAYITVPVTLWYGQFDVMVPVAMGEYLAKAVPGSRLHVVENGAHFSTINNHFAAICNELRSAAEGNR